MMTIGDRFRITIFGSSHGPEVGIEIDGIPSGTAIELAAIQRELDRRRPVGRRLATKRHEEDILRVDEGLTSGITTGGRFRAHVANEDVQRAPYDRLKDIPRPGHADYPARMRYGAEADLSGGGIFSGRMTVGLVIAGAIARQLLARIGIDIVAFTVRIGSVKSEIAEQVSMEELRSLASANEVGCPDDEAARRMESAIGEARRVGDSVGGTIEARITGVPVGLGEPFFDSIESVLAHLAFSIPAIKGVEFGAGFAAAAMMGSQHNDAFVWRGDSVRTNTNHAGGILGGLATGEPIVFRVAVKPTSSIALPQQSVNLATHEAATVVVAGRHDPCIVPRAIVVVESVAAIGLVDLALRGGFLR